MCYSAQIKADYGKFVREFGAVIDIHEFVRLFWEKREDGGWTKLPKAMRDSFRKPAGEEGFELANIVAEGDRELEAKLVAELAAQQERLAKAEAVLAGPKPTKKALEDQRIAGNKVKAAQRRLIPMRYQCRLPGWTEAIERKYPGTYNARRDKLEESWGKLFGYHHGIMIVTKFYENVDRDGKNAILEFTPNPPQEMLVACLWAHTKGPGGELWSFAAITDEPPPEVLAAGHDRCIIPIKPEHLDAWLNPDPRDLQALYDILDDRPRPYYEHRLAA